MPTRAIHQYDGMTALRDGSADLIEMKLHGMGVGPRHHDGRADPSCRADGAEQIGALIALIGGLTRPCAFAGPEVDKAVLLSQPGLILPPNLYGFAASNVAHMGGKRRGEVF